MRMGARLLVAVLGLSMTPTAGMATQTLSGVLPPGRVTKVLTFRRPLLPQPMHFQFTAPPVNAGVGYALTFCIGAPANPCGLPSDITVDVLKGQTKSATFNSSLFARRVFVVGQGTRVSVPYLVKITP